MGFAFAAIALLGVLAWACIYVSGTRQMEFEERLYQDWKRKAVQPPDRP